MADVKEIISVKTYQSPKILERICVVKLQYLMVSGQVDNAEMWRSIYYSFNYQSAEDFKIGANKTSLLMF